MLTRVIAALALTALCVAAFALVIARTDFVSNNICAYAVATIEEASSAHVKVARCTVDPLAGQLTIDGLEVGDAQGALHLTVARVFIHVVLEPFTQRLRLERLEVDHPDISVRIAASEEKPKEARECLPPVLDSFELGRVTVRKASLEIRSEQGLRVSVPRLSAALDGRDQLLAVRASARGGSVALPGRSAGLISARVAAHLDLRGAGTLQVDKADLIGTELSAFVTGKIEDLCRPRIDAAANVRIDDLKLATDRLTPKLLEGVQGSLAVDATIELSQGKPRLRGDLRTKALALEGFSPGELHARFDLTPQSLKLDPLEIPFLGKGGDASVRAEVGLAGALPITAEASLHEMELAELLGRLGILRSHVVLKVGGRASVKGTLAPLQLAGDAALELSDFAVLDRRFEQRARAKRILEFGRGHLASAVNINANQVTIRGGKLDVQGSRLFVDGTLSTDVKVGVDLHVHGEGFALEDLRGHLASIPWRGKTTLDGEITGAYGDQTITADSSIERFHFFDLSLGDVSSHIFFQGLKLSLTNIEARKGRSRYQGNIALDFNQDDIPVEAHIELPEAYLHDMVDLSVGLVPSFSPLTDAADVEGQVTGTIDVKGPVAGPEGTAALEFEDVSLWEQTFEDGDAHFTLRGQVPQLLIDNVTLRHGEARLNLAGTFGPEWKLNVDAATDQFTLADLDSMRIAALTGPLQSNMQVRGVAGHPLIDIETTFTNGYAGKALLGDGAISLKVDGKQMNWKGTIGTHALSGQGHLEGDFGYTSSLQLRFPDLTGYFQSFVPKLELEGGSASADVALAGSLIKWRDSHGTIDISQLRLRRGGLSFENDGPGRIEFGVFGIDVKRLAMRGDDLTFFLQGTRSREGRLDFHTNAALDARLFPSLLPDLEHAAGHIALQAAVTGTQSAPTVLGNLRVEDGELRLRGIPLALRELNGGLSFSQDALAIDEMQGKVNNGSATLSGRIEMKNLNPQMLDVALHMADVNATLREGMQGTLDGELTVQGPPLEPTLGGSLSISRMVYAEDIDIERSLLDFSRRPPQPRVLDRSDILVHFGLDLHLSRGVRIENNLARTDLKGDLRLTGTSRSFGLTGSINTVHGTAAFRGNEFQIEQGVLSFNDTQRIRPSFDFQALAQVKDYKVRLHAFGTPAEPHLKLSSEPALSDADIGFLLTFGFVSQNLQQANFSAADSGLALGIEAVNKMTGFSEQVRRLIPKNAILRDPNIDFVTDYSNVTTGGGARLEAMARFSSHLLNDKLDVRVMEGLSTRRYRAQLGYQISDALQAQFQIDNEHEYVDTDYGADLKMRWEAE